MIKGTPGHLFRGSLTKDVRKDVPSWRVRITIQNKQVDKVFYNFRVADIFLRALSRLQEYFYAKRTLEFWGLHGVLDELEQDNYLELTKGLYGEMSPARRQVLIDLYNEINRRLGFKRTKDRLHLGRKPFLGSQEDCRITPVKEKWRKKLMDLGYLKKQKERYDSKENKFRE